MIDYEKLQEYQRRVHCKLWKLLFKRNFKRFGKNTRIIPPMCLYGARYIDIGNNVTVNNNAWLGAFNWYDPAPRMVIDDGTNIGQFSHLVAIKDVYIGKNVLIAHRVFISDCTHPYEDINVDIINWPAAFRGRVHIGDGSWLGENVCVLSACIGKHCVIGANSVVLENIPDYSVAVGAPAKVVKRYDHNTKKWHSVG